MAFQFKSSRRTLMPLWRNLRPKQENTLNILQKKYKASNRLKDIFRLNHRLKRYFCLLYNLKDNTFQKTIQLAQSYQGNITTNIVFTLEKRLDITLFRAGLSKSINHSRQLINHRHVKINNKLVKSPSYQLESGDIFSLDCSIRNNNFSLIKATHLEVNYKISTGIFLYKPDQVYYPSYFDINDLHKIIN